MKKPPYEPTVVSLDQLRELELGLDAESEDTDISDLAAEQELDFNAVVEREYLPEVWEVENEEVPDDTWNDAAPSRDT